MRLEELCACSNLAKNHCCKHFNLQCIKKNLKEKDKKYFQNKNLKKAVLYLRS